jgi:hypothetical protein
VGLAVVLALQGGILSERKLAVAMGAPRYRVNGEECDAAAQYKGWRQLLEPQITRRSAKKERRAGGDQKIRT